MTTEVFPAYAGVFLFSRRRGVMRHGLPRIRGGVSDAFRQIDGEIESSPHTRGCFSQSILHSPPLRVFPAYAGVFLDSGERNDSNSRLPRIRGGVSRPDDRTPGRETSSPHTRGCFWRLSPPLSPCTVFPAYAGVFLTADHDQKVTGRLPRIRGGVSAEVFQQDVLTRSSPHTRGCFLTVLRSVLLLLVFPAYAGVFPGLSPPCAG